MKNNALVYVLGGAALAALIAAGFVFWRGSDGSIPTSESATADPVVTPSEEAPDQTAEETGDPAPETDAASEPSETVTADPAPEAAPEEPDADSAAAVDTDPAEPAAEEAASAGDPAETAPDATPPEFDVVRIPPDGQALVAGQADPGMDVAVLLDGSEVSRSTADAGGNFVAFIEVPPSDEARMLSLLADPDGARIAGASDYLVSPFGALVAEATEPEPAPEASTDLAMAEPAEEPMPDAPTGDAEAVAQTDPEPAASESATEDRTEMADAGDGEEAAPAEPTGTATTETVAEAGDATAAETDPAPTAPAILSVSEEGVEVVQPATALPPEVMANVALDAITYDESGEVSLSGRASGEGFVRVYIDNDPVTTGAIEADGGWRIDLPEVETGVYTLRVDEVDAEGTVVSRIETPFLREEPADVAAAMAEETADPTFNVAMRTVQPGNTLWAIARDRYGEGILYVHVFEANRGQIRDPDLIYPGQIFVLPTLPEN